MQDIAGPKSHTDCHGYGYSNRHTELYSDRDSDCRPNRNSYRYSNRNTERYPDGNTHGYSDRDGYRYTDCHCHCYTSRDSYRYSDSHTNGDGRGRSGIESINALADRDRR